MFKGSCKCEHLILSNMLKQVKQVFFFDFISLILALPVSTMDSLRNILVSLFQQSVGVTRYEPEKAVDVDFLPFMI